MQTISMFYGIIIRMMFSDIGKHHLPHIHVTYQDYKASIQIPNGELLDGDLPNKQLKLIQAWLLIHEEDIMANWQLAVNNESVFKIEPLR
jgi:hypothetical protein